jgi:hypothetical protein
MFVLVGMKVQRDDLNDSMVTRIKHLALVSLIAALLIETGTNASAAAPDAYPLDEVSRSVQTRRGKVICPKLPLTPYNGTSVKYHRSVRVHPAFIERLKRFEKVAVQVAKEVYGRAPTKMRHIGAYNCRRIGGYPEYLSEHGLGNGIDVAGFDFKGLSKAERQRSELPRHLKRAFKVRLGEHWKGKGRTRLHKDFLHTLAKRLVARKDIFRVLLGPAFPGHKTHFHFDMAPWRLVDIW